MTFSTHERVTLKVTYDDGWRKIRVPVRRYNETKVHESSKEELVVPEAVHDISEGDLPFKSRLALILLKTQLHIISLLFAEPLGIFRKIRDYLTKSAVEAF